uniref:Twin-arginine translocation signal domain-containing protein n=1 Tax=Schlesneria paludicola TaxID=360056 RepID=A0A7C2JY14_9PLAN
MTEPNRDDENARITRRIFLQHSAAATALSAGVCGIVLKTDAQTPTPVPTVGPRGNGQEGFPYGYVTGP